MGREKFLVKQYKDRVVWRFDIYTLASATADTFVSWYRGEPTDRFGYFTGMPVPCATAFGSTLPVWRLISGA